RRGLGVPPAHRAAAFALAARADMRPAFLLLLGGLAMRFLALVAGRVLPVFARAVVFRIAGFLQRDRDGLPAALHLAAAAALQLAMLEFVHDAARGLTLAWACMWHRVLSMLAPPRRDKACGCAMFPAAVMTARSRRSAAPVRHRW